MTSTTGISNRGTRGFRNGFTLIELMVVLALLAVVGAISVPRFRQLLPSDSQTEAAGWLMIKLAELKTAAVLHQTDYLVTFDLDEQKIWVSTEAMPPAEREAAQSRAYRLPGEIRLLDVEYPYQGVVTSGRTRLRFYKAGYSQRALIHLQTPDPPMVTFRVDAFLPRIERIDGQVTYEQ